MKKKIARRVLTGEQAKAVVREIINHAEQALAGSTSKAAAELERIFKFPLGLTFAQKQKYARFKLRSLRRLITRTDGPLNQRNYFLY
jgi:hypothetical protein